MNSAYKKINLNQIFLSLGIFHGPYDGQRISRCPLFLIYSKFVLWFNLIHSIKFLGLFFIDKHDYLVFVLADYFHNESKNVHKFTVIIMSAYSAWTFSSVWMYQRVNYDTRDAYWLTMLPPFDQPIRLWKQKNIKKKMTGLSHQQFDSFQRMYYKWSRLSFKVIIFFVFMMETFASVIYFISFFPKFMHKSHFWLLFIGNTFPTFFLFLYFDYSFTLGMSLNYTFLAIMVKQRLDNVRLSLNEVILDLKSCSRTISYHTRQFNLIFLNILRVNRFWSKIFGINFFFAIFIIFCGIQVNSH